MSSTSRPDACSFGGCDPTRARHAEHFNRIGTFTTAKYRHCQPDEIVGAAVLLASEAGSYVNGHTLVVYGGMLTY